MRNKVITTTAELGDAALLLNLYCRNDWARQLTFEFHLSFSLVFRAPLLRSEPLEAEGIRSGLCSQRQLNSPVEFHRSPSGSENFQHQITNCRPTHEKADFSINLKAV